MPPQRGKPLKLYISASERSIGSLLAQNNEGGKVQAMYYLSRILTEVKTRYTPVEKLCLALYFTACKLMHYMLPCHIHIIAKTDVVKYMLSKPMLTKRLENGSLHFQNTASNMYFKGQSRGRQLQTSWPSTKSLKKKRLTSQELWKWQVYGSRQTKPVRARKNGSGKKWKE
ncbi:hypothetical protein FF1_040286 [Malus domestica]